MTQTGIEDPQTTELDSIADTVTVQSVYTVNSLTICYFNAVSYLSELFSCSDIDICAVAEPRFASDVLDSEFSPYGYIVFPMIEIHHTILRALINKRK